MARLWGGRSAGPSAFGPEVVPTGFGFAARSVVDSASAWVAALIPASAGAVRSGLVTVSLGGLPALPVISPPIPPGVDAHTGGSAVDSVLVDGHLVHLPGIEVQLLEILVAQPGRVVALEAVVAGLGISAARAIRVARRLRRRLLVSPVSPPLIEIIPRAGIRYVIILDNKG